LFKSSLLWLALLLSFTRLSFAQQTSQQRPPNVPPAAQPAATPAPAPVPDEPPRVTQHEIRLDERTIKYTVTTGMMPIKNQVSGETEARMFFMAYTLDGVSDLSKRPLMLSFNGGPGSSSVWLRLGALGPKRVKMQDNGMTPAPPYQLVTNDHTWLYLTDLVLIDPVGTGYSRATRPARHEGEHQNGLLRGGAYDVN
jgi:carboxypeptidase C (cathepsin A)